MSEDFSKNTQTNIGYWEQVIKAPTPAYQDIFDNEQKYLSENIRAGAKVLDIGCGDGRNIKNILKATPFVTGIDNDSKAVEDSQRNFESISTVKVIQADAVNLPFEDGSFDVVTFLMILPNLDKNKNQALQEASRVLKKNGFLILSTFAETAFEERMKVYKKFKVPIKKVDGTKVIFNESLGSNVSEQFSKEELIKLGSKAGLTMIDCKGVGVIAYICKFKKLQR